MFSAFGGPRLSEQSVQQRSFSQPTKDALLGFTRLVDDIGTVM